MPNLKPRVIASLPLLEHAAEQKRLHVQQGPALKSRYLDSTLNVRGEAIIHGTVISHGNKLPPPKSRSFSRNTNKTEQQVECPIATCGLRRFGPVCYRNCMGARQVGGDLELLTNSHTNSIRIMFSPPAQCWYRVKSKFVLSFTSLQVSAQNLWFVGCITKRSLNPRPQHHLLLGSCQVGT